MNNFLLDEHLPRWWRPAILRVAPGLTVWYVGDVGAPPLHSLDPVILDWCEGHQFLLLTNNRQSMPGHLAHHLAQGRHMPGILVVDTTLGVSAVAADLALISGAGRPDDFLDQIRYLPIAP